MINDSVIKNIDCNSGLLKFVDNSDEMAYFDEFATHNVGDFGKVKIIITFRYKDIHLVEEM